MIAILVIIAYILTIKFVLKVIPKKTESLNPVLRIVIQSFFYALVFGIGVAGSGGDPGFALPAPIFIVPFLTNPDLMANSVLFPFLFWWVLIFSVMISRLMIKNRKLRNLNKNAT